MKVPASTWLLTLAVLASASACGAAASTPSSAPQAPPAAPASAAPSSTAGPASVSAPAEAAPAPTAVAPSAATSSFPPAPIAAPHAKTAQPGDGQWEPIAEGGTVDGRAVLYRTTLHPHPQNKWVYVVLVAIDLTRAELSLVAGTKEPVNDAISKEERGGLVPLDEQPRLAAVFNGGFQAGHGHYGMRLGGKLYVKPRPDACTIVLRAPSQIEIGSHASLQIDESVSFRQTPPCLVENGKRNPLLDGERTSKKWGGAEDGRKDIRRTALAVDESRKTLYFAFADWITAGELAEALTAAHVSAAAELDINWSFTRFLFFGPAEDGSGLEVTGTLVDQIEHRKRGYVQKSEPRDFFYVTRIERAKPTENGPSASPPVSAPKK